MPGTHECWYCHGWYASTGGLTLHYSHCPERAAYLRKQEADLRNQEINLRVQEAEAKTPHITINQNVTIIQVTQQLITSEIPLFDAFRERLLSHIGLEAAAWCNGSDAARVKIREIKTAIDQSSDENNKAIGNWLASKDVDREIDANIDEDKILQHTSAQVNQIERAALEAIRMYMSEEEQARFTAAFKEAGSLFAV